MALNRMFCGFQPTVLKARLRAWAVSPVWVELRRVASSRAALVAVTCTSPSLPAVVVTVLSLMKASALVITRLVTIWPLRATELPSPKALPPEELTVLLAMARMEPSSTASISTSPSTSTSADSMKASTPPRTSFITTMPPMAMELESVRLPMFGNRMSSKSWLSSLFHSEFIE